MANGCTNISPYINVAISPDETPTVLALGETTFCEGGSVNINLKLCKFICMEQWRNNTIN
jgi:hypothetical protein